MRTTLVAFLGLTFIAALPAHGANEIDVSCMARGLAAGAQLWVEVTAQYQSLTALPPARGGFRNAAQPESASGPFVWQFTVPASGEVAPTAYRFEFPVEITSAEPDHFGAIYLKTRFRIDHPQGLKRTGYGEVHEVTFATPVPPGASQLSRCLRLREEGDRFIVETAADCRDATFAKAAHGTSLGMKMPSR